MARATTWSPQPGVIVRTTGPDAGIPKAVTTSARVQIQLARTGFDFLILCEHSQDRDVAAERQNGELDHCVNEHCARHSKSTKETEHV